MDESSKKLIGIAALVIIIAGGIKFIQSQNASVVAFNTGESSNISDSNQNWNFMIGLCTSNNDIDPVPCDKEAIRNITFSDRPNGLITFMRYGSNDITFQFIEPSQSRIKLENLGGRAIPDMELISPVLYEKGLEKNSVITITTMPNNCVYKDLFRKNGNSITQQTLSYSGGCTEEQRAAGDYLIQKNQQNLVVLQ